MSKKEWKKPELKRIEAGSAENGTVLNRADRLAGGNANKS